MLNSSTHNDCIHINTSPVFDGCYTLVDKHANAIKHSASARFSLADQNCTGRIVDSVSDHQVRTKRSHIDIQPTVDIRK